MYSTPNLGQNRGQGTRTQQTWVIPLKNCLMPLILSLGLVLLCGCARDYLLTRHDGTDIRFQSYSWGDQEYYYSCEFENGQLKAERYGFKRKISPVMEAGAGLAESALAGAKSAL